MKALVVDDMKDFREIFCFCLESRYEVLQARDAESALQILRTLAIDLLVTDFQMPGCSGLDLIEQVIEEKIKVRNVILISSSLPSLDLWIKDRTFHFNFYTQEKGAEGFAFLINFDPRRI